MNETNETFEQTRAVVEPSARKPFETPRVEDLGELRDLTQQFGTSI